jgi:hypothetical protein
MRFGHRLYFDVPYDSEKEQQHETACIGGGGGGGLFSVRW